MYKMFSHASSFDQDISAWCVENLSGLILITQSIPFEDDHFDEYAGFEGDNAKQPNWGDAC
jgi:hypothetical protein